ncbi:MAG: WecB/TagA/CpsF family glycosyltransferase, partial [Methylophaga sp.]|nr:WecB/TagA/CpsF family glycosyltransferase [Methylophaga sp.]
MARLIGNIRIVDSDAQALACIASRAAVQQAFVVTFINAHAVNLFFNDHGFQQAVLSSNLLLRDGSGMRLLYRWLSLPAGKNMNGTDFIPKILTAHSEQSIVIYGASDQALTLVKQQLIQAKFKVLDCINGFQDMHTYLENSQKHRPQIILLAMGMPKQELLSQQLSQQLHYSALIINGGGIVDFMSGIKQRAPGWIRRI